MRMQVLRGFESLTLRHKERTEERRVIESASEISENPQVVWGFFV